MRAIGVVPSDMQTVSKRLAVSPHTLETVNADTSMWVVFQYGKGICTRPHTKLTQLYSSLEVLSMSIGWSALQRADWAPVNQLRLLSPQKELVVVDTPRAWRPPFITESPSQSGSILVNSLRCCSIAIFP